MVRFFGTFKSIFLGACIVAVIVAVIYLLCYSCQSSFTKTENRPTVSITLEDIQYKGHTYILLRSAYGKSLVHAEHCKCHTVKK